MGSRTKYLFLYNVQKSLNDKGKSFKSRALILLSAWDQLFVFLRTCNLEDMEAVMKDAVRFTHKFILHGDWSQLPADLRSKLVPTIKKCMPFAAKLSPQALKSCESLLTEIPSPWMYPALQAILRDRPTTDGEIKDFLSKEGFHLILIRLEVLCEEGCKDLALRLTEKCLKNIDAFEKQKIDKTSLKNKINTLKDMYYTLLAHYNRISDIVQEITKLNMSEGLKLVRRWQSKRSHLQEKSRKGISSRNVCEIIAHTALSTAMVKSVQSLPKQRLLYELIKEWLMMLSKNGKSLSQVNDSIRKMLVPAESSIHMFMFCLVLKEFDYRYRSICVEIFIRGLTLNINELEVLKTSEVETRSILRSEIRLSNGFLQFGDFLKDKVLICREAVLTAFSLHPTIYSMHLLFELAYLSKKSSKRVPITYLRKLAKNETYSAKRVLLFNGKVKHGECLNLKPLYKKSSNGTLLDSGNTSPYESFDSDSLDLPPQLCDDLTTVLNGPRNLSLSWTLEWKVLKARCKSYFEDYYEKYDLSDVISPEDYEPVSSDDENLSGKKLSEREEYARLYGHLIHFDLEPRVYVRDIFQGGEFKKYLKHLNLNPRVVLTRMPMHEILAYTNKCSSNESKPDDEGPSDISSGSGLNRGSSSASTSRDADTILVQSVPGMDSLDMIIPESQEPTIQVVQISTCNSATGQSSVTTECQTVNVPDNSFKNSPIYSQPRNTAYTSPDCMKKDSCSDYVHSLSSSQSAPKENVNSSWSQVSRNALETADMKLGSNMNCNNTCSYSSTSTGTNTTPPRIGEGCSNETTHPINPIVCDKKSVGCETDEDNKDKLKKFEFDSREVSIGNIKNANNSHTAAKPKGNPGQSKEDPKLSSGSILRVIVTDCKNSDQFIPIETRNDNKTDLSKMATPSVISSYSSSDQLLKLVCKKDTAQEISQSACLPNFQHVFGRQGYQTQSDKAEGNVSNVNCHIATSPESQKDNRPTTAISKASQTVPKEEVNSDDRSLSPEAVYRLESYPQSLVSDLPSSSATQSLILAYKLPVTNSSSQVEVVQLNQPSVLKKSSPELCTKSVKHHGSQTNNPNETVIRNNMNLLLAAALNSPIKNAPTSAASSNTPSTMSKGVQMDKSVGDDNSCQPKPKPPSKRTPRKTAASNISRIVRSIGPPPTVMNNVCQTEPPVVSMQVPLKSVQVLNNDLNPSDTTVNHPNCSNSINLSDTSGTSNNSIASSPVESSAVSSTTLEQLREFESVLEHITNTSQMKEKSSIHERLEEHSISSPSETLALENKSTNLVNALTVVDSSTTTSVCCPDNNKTTSISPPASSMLNTPKMPASTSVVLVSGSVVSPTTSVSSQSPVSPMPMNNSSSGCKLNSKSSKSKTKSVSKTTSPTSTIKVTNLPKPQQKPQEDEQTTQRIYAILDKYAEQLRNSPELKNKPAPRRRSNPPSNPSHSNKRKKSSHSKSKSNTNLPSSSLDLSPSSEDLHNIGSEDSSNGVSQLSQNLNSPQDTEEITTAALGNFSSDIPETADKESQSKHQIVISDALQNTTGRTAVIVQDNIQQSVINMDNSKLISGKQVVVGGAGTVPLALLPAGGNVKQVIFPVTSDCRPLVVAAKVPKMYRVLTTGGVPTGSPILSTSSSTVLLRQMCLNKASPAINLKPLKLPVMSSANASSLTSQAVVLPTTAQTIPLTSTSFSEAFGVSLDSTIMINSHSPNSLSLVSNKRLNKESCQDSLAGSSNETPVSLSSVLTQSKMESVIVSCQDTVVNKILPVIDNASHNSKTPNAGNPAMYREHSSHKLPNTESPKRMADKIWSQTLSSSQKEGVNIKEEPLEANADVNTDANPSVNTGVNTDVISTVVNTSVSTVVNTGVNTDVITNVAADFNSEIIRQIKTEPSDQIDLEKTTNSGSGKEKILVEDEQQVRKDSFSVICTNESVIKSGFYNNNTPQNLKPNTDSTNSSKPIVSNAANAECQVKSSSKDRPVGATSTHSKSQNTQQTIFTLHGPVFNIKPKARPNTNSFKTTDSSQARLPSNKRLRFGALHSVEDKILTEDILDLGVDRPSTSDLFPEAELMLGQDNLSREPVPVELFRVESSSSSSPSQSPTLGGKSGSSLWFKQTEAKKSQAKKSKFNSFGSKFQTNNLSCSSSKKKKNQDGISNQILTNNPNLPFNPNFGSTSSGLTVKLVDMAGDNKSDTWSDDCNFNELDASIDSLDPDIHNAAKMKPYPDLASEILHMANSELSSDAVDVPLQQCYNISNNCMSISNQKNGVNPPNTSNTAVNTEGTSTNLNYPRKRKSFSPIKYDADDKLCKMRRTLLDSSDESSSLPGNSGGYFAGINNSSSKELIKKDFPCFNVTTGTQLNKKTSTDPNDNKEDKIMFPSQSALSAVSKKTPTTKPMKTSCKKRS